MLAKVSIVLSPARHAGLPFNLAAAIYRLRRTGCQAGLAGIEICAISTSSEAKFLISLSHGFIIRALRGRGKEGQLSLYRDNMVCYTWRLVLKK
jgi:hypothetical protein